MWRAPRPRRRQAARAWTAAGSSAELLVGIAGPWFDGGFPEDVPLAEQLPSQEVVPAGFTETSRQEESVPGS